MARNFASGPSIVPKQEPIVIRRSGIWNSRSPFNDYVRFSRKNGRSTSVLGLGAYQLKYMALNETNKSRTVKALLNKLTTDGFREAGKHCSRYQSQFPNDANLKPRPPLVSHLESDIELASLYALEKSLITQYSIFEQFVHCWFLNISLAILENGQNLSRRHQNLLEQYNPFFGRTSLPDVRTVLEAFRTLWNVLRVRPRMKLDRIAGVEVETRCDPEESVLMAILFWRDYRNLVVHSGGLATTGFVTKYGGFFRRCLKEHVGADLVAFSPLPLAHSVLGAMSTALYIAATFLNAHLEQLSGFRRGHPEAPGLRTHEDWPSVPVSPPLLTTGDHVLSLKWLGNEGMAEIAAKRGWKPGEIHKPILLREL